MKLKIKKLNKDAIIPNYAHDGDAGFDLYSIMDFKISPNERKSIPTGIAMGIPKGYVGLMWDKSGLSHKSGIKLFGGVIDSGYRGEVYVGLINLSKKKFEFKKGHKIAQMLIQKVERVDFKEVEDLGKTTRDKGGFGSTGK